MNRALSRCLMSLAVVAASGLLWRGLIGGRNRAQATSRRNKAGAGIGFPSAAPAVQDSWHCVNGLRVFSRHAGPPQEPAGLPLVLVHGFGVSGRYFIALANSLANEYSIYIPDLPGHGRSETPPRALDINGLAQALLEWLDTRGLRRCVLVGQSMGAQIVVEAAVRQPRRFVGLVLIGPTADPQASLATHVWRLLRVAPHEHLSLFPILAIDYLRMGWRLVPECRAMLEDPVEQKLIQLTLPVLLMKGRRDAIVSDRWFQTLRERTCTLSTVIIEGEGHAVQHSAPDAVANALRPYLRYLLA